MKLTWLTIFSPQVYTFSSLTFCHNYRNAVGKELALSVGSLGLRLEASGAGPDWPRLTSGFGTASGLPNLDTL